VKRGQKPTPTSLKLVTGNPGNRKLNESEPRPTGEVQKPSFIKGAAARIWAKYTPSLIEQGVLTPWDADMFGTWCVLMAEFQKDPDRFTSARLTQMRALAGAFGLLPAERARLKTPGQKDQKADPAAKYFGRSGS